MMRYQIHIRSFDRTLVAIDDFQLDAGEITVLLGESGIGKTLIAQAIFGLLDAHEFDISINGKPYRTYLHSGFVRRLQRNGFFVFQEPSTHLNPLMTLQEQLNEGPLAKAANRQEEILRILWQQPYETHIRPLLKVYPKPFRPSGGEKQRILLAMAFKKLALTAGSANRLFVFDEPTGSLDNAYRNIFLRELLRQYAQNPFTILLITHDYSMISQIEKRHSALLPKIHFKELRRFKGPKAQVFNFKANEYTTWLKKQRAAAKGKHAANTQTVLTVEPEFKVFGKTFFLKQGAATGKPVPLVLHRQELIYLKAPSGMGKTTLAKIIAGLQRPQYIRFKLAGFSFSETTDQNVWRKHIWGKKLAMVFQHADEALNLQARVRDIFKGLPNVKFRNDRQISDVLQEVFEWDLPQAFLQQKVAYLSGGQKQRLNLLRALVLHPDLIILDEPLNGLDFASIGKVLDIIRRKMAAGSGILLISHNEEIFERLVSEENCYYLTDKAT